MKEIRTRALSSLISDLSSLSSTIPNYERFVENVLTEFNKHTKLVMMEDIESSFETFKGLDVESLRLPFSTVAIYYKDGPSKAMVLVKEIEDGLELKVAVIAPKTSHWIMIPGRSRVSLEPLLGAVQSIQDLDQLGVTNPAMEATKRSLFNNAGTVVLIMLKALSCKNVALKEHKAAGTSAKKGREPIVYNSFHVITVESLSKGSGGTGKGTPTREHLRRGHVHRFKTKDGHVNHWINALVVNAGKGRGVITSAYKI